MQPSSAEIDRIVREVVRRLQQDDLAVPSSSLSSSHDPTTLVVDERVVTVGVLRGRLKGVGQLQVRSDAIVTPLVHDLLKDESVQLLRAITNGSDKAQRHNASYLLVEDPRWQTASILSRLISSGREWQLARDWESLLADLARSAANTGVVCSPQWADRVCSANQQGVRAALAADLLSVDEAMQQTPVKMMIVNTNRLSEAAAIEIANRYITLATQTK